MKKNTTEAISRLHVGDCAFVRRGDGTWTYSTVARRSDADGGGGVESTITFRVDSGRSTKRIGADKWAGHVRLPAPAADVLPGFSVGDPPSVGGSDMILTSREETVLAVSELREGDAAFLKRSDGSWSYAILISRPDGDDPEIKFQINERGSTKSIKISQCGNYVRCINHNKHHADLPYANVLQDDESRNIDASASQLCETIGSITDYLATKEALMSAQEKQHVSQEILG